MTSPSRYQLSVILTDECNMRCRYCTTAKRPVAITEVLLDRIAWLLERTSPAALDINFHGGEPTMVWESVLGLEDRLATLERKGDRRITRSLCTNGTYLDAERARFLAERGFNVRLSIDGREGSHTLYRFPKGGRKTLATVASYNATLEGLELLIAAGASTAANMVVTPGTVRQLAQNAVFLIKQGLVHLVISPVVGMPWADEEIGSSTRSCGRSARSGGTGCRRSPLGCTRTCAAPSSPRSIGPPTALARG